MDEMEFFKASNETPSPRVKLELVDRSSRAEVSTEQKKKEPRYVLKRNTAVIKGTSFPELISLSLVDEADVLSFDPCTGKAVSTKQKKKETRSLQVCYTAQTEGTNSLGFTAGVTLDGELVTDYDSSSGKLIPLKECIKKDDTEFHWNDLQERMWSDKEDLTDLLNKTVKSHKPITGIHTMQRMYGCELDDDGTTRGYEQYRYDGEDFLILNLGNLTCTAATDKALIIKQRFEKNGYTARRKNYLQNNCIAWLKKCGSCSRPPLERKDPCGGLEGGSEGVPIGVIACGLVGVLALVGIITGILFWKKKKPGFRRSLSRAVYRRGAEGGEEGI